MKKTILTGLVAGPRMRLTGNTTNEATHMREKKEEMKMYNPEEHLPPLIAPEMSEKACPHALERVRAHLKKLFSNEAAAERRINIMTRAEVEQLDAKLLNPASTKPASNKGYVGHSEEDAAPLLPARYNWLTGQIEY